MSEATIIQKRIASLADVEQHLAIDGELLSHAEQIAASQLRLEEIKARRIAVDAHIADNESIMTAIDELISPAHVRELAMTRLRGTAIEAEMHRLKIDRACITMENDAVAVSM